VLLIEKNKLLTKIQTVCSLSPLCILQTASSSFHRRMWTTAAACLLVTLLWFIQSTCELQNTCPLFSSSNFGSNFFPTPQNITLTACSSDSPSCCQTNYDSAVERGVDIISQTVSQKISLQSSTTCAAAIKQLACSPCSFDQSVIIERSGTTDNFILHICDRYCEYLFAQCANATVNGTTVTVAATYSSASQFCYDVLSSSAFTAHSVDITRSRRCYDAQLPKCTTSDILTEVSECTNGVQSVHYYWNRLRQCAGGIILPADIKRSCPITCADNTYLPEGGTSCLPCPSGTTSSVTRCFVNWNTWPTVLPVRTFCVPTYPDWPVDLRNCTGWQLRGNRIDSGIAGRDAVTSVLQMMVNVVRHSYVAFVGTVDAEYYYDRFTFEVDGKVQIWVNNSLSQQTFIVPLSIGEHSLEWKYRKDSSVSRGLDAAVIWAIYLEGTIFAAEKCVPVAQDPCYGQNISRFGFPCKTSDFEMYWTPCVNNSSYRVWRYKQPQLCDDAAPNSVPLPPPDTTPTACINGCPFGYWKRPNQTNCEICPAGYYFTSSAGCQRCPPRTYSESAASLNCSQCGFPTEQTPDATDCVPTCLLPVFANATSNSSTALYYNLSIAQQRWFNLVHPISGNRYQFLISLCNKQPFCTQTNTCLRPAFIFAQDPEDVNNPISLGRHMNYIPGPVDGQFQIEYTDGDNSWFLCWNGPTRVVIDFQCSDQVGIGSPEWKATSNPCLLSFAWTTSLACRVCIDSDWQENIGRCLNGQQVTTYTRKNLCRGVRNPVISSCDVIEVPRITLSVAMLLGLAAICFLIALAVVVIVFWKKKKQFEYKYHQLINEQEQPTELAQ